MHIYKICANYNKMKENNQHKGYVIYIDGRTKASGNVVRFINSSCPGSTWKTTQWYV